MNKNRVLTPLAAVLILTGSFVLTGCDEKAASAEAPPPQEVGVVTLQAEKLNVSTELPGRTASYRIAEVRPQVGGIILKRQFVEGSEIKAGESLYQIDPAVYKAAYDVAKGDLAKAQANAEITSLTVKRYQPLLGTRYISRQDYDTAVSTARQANADVIAAKANLESARINLAYTKVSSPIDGRIGKSTVTEGALVTAGQADALATVQQLDPIYVDVTQSSTDFLRLKGEMASGALKQVDGKASVELTMEDGTKYAEKGTLEFSDVTVDEGTGSITIRAIFPNPQKVLLPGMFVRATLDEGVKQNALLIPQRGVTRNTRGEATTMVVVNKALKDKEGKDVLKDGKPQLVDQVEQRVIKVGQTIGDKWLVLDGVSSGDRIIITGLMKIGPGAPVTAKPYVEESKKDNADVAKAEPKQ